MVVCVKNNRILNPLFLNLKSFLELFSISILFLVRSSLTGCSQTFKLFLVIKNYRQFSITQLPNKLTPIDVVVVTDNPNLLFQICCTSAVHSSLTSPQTSKRPKFLRLIMFFFHCVTFFQKSINFLFHLFDDYFRDTCTISALASFFK